ncbi:MAG: hypothetical protein ACLTSL_06010 [Odoribacter splanchnicus]
MSYGLKYRLSFDSVSGTPYEINILEAGYDGPVENRNLGSAPVLKMDDGEAVRGTSLELSIETCFDGDLREFYTTDRKKFRVEVYRSGVLFWSGHILPELYSEPYISVPFDVSVTASDGLGLLKNIPFGLSGKRSVFDVIKYCCEQTGLVLNYVFASKLLATGMSGVASVYTQAFVDCNAFDDADCYEALEKVLITFGSYIKQKDCKWHVLRYTDQDTDLMEYDPSCNFAGGFRPVMKTLGAIGDDTYPVGQLESEIVPARKDFTMEQPYELYPSLLKDYCFAAVGSWILSPGVRFMRVDEETYCELKPTKLPEKLEAYVMQSISVEACNRPFRIEFQFSICLMSNREIGSIGMSTGRSFRLEIFITDSGGTRHYLSAEGWGTKETYIEVRGDVQNGKLRITDRVNYDYIPASFETFRINLERIPYSGEMAFRIVNPYKYYVVPGTPALDDYNDMNIICLKEFVFTSDVDGNPDVNVLLNPEASTSAPSLKVGFVDAPFTENARGIFKNILMTSGGFTSEWHCRGSGLDSFANIALQDMSSRIGVPSFCLHGVIHATDFDLLSDKYSGRKLYLKEYSYDLMEEEIDCTLCELLPFNAGIDGEITQSPRSSNKSKTETRASGETEYRSYGGTISTPKMIRELASMPDDQLSENCLLEVDDRMAVSSKKVTVGGLMDLSFDQILQSGAFWTKEEMSHTGGYLEVQGEKIKAGDSDKWNAHEFDDFLDQPVRKIDSVQFKQVTADNITTDEITSSQFVSGPLGHGYRINKNGEAEFQNLTIHGTFSVFELLIQQIRAVGGQLLVSSASIKTSLVEETPSGYKCFFNTENGKIPNPFIAGDQAIHQVFTGNSINRYWRLVTEIGTDYFLLSKTDCEAGSGIPSAGDEIMLLGNRTDESRQGAILISAYGNNTPFVAYYAGINSFFLSGKEIMREGNLNGIVDEDFGQLQGFGVYIQKAYIKGILRLMSGKTVEEVIQDTIAKIVDITASSQVFKYGDGYIGTPSPASIVLTALPRNFTPTSYQWQYLNGSTWTNISGATSSTYSVIPGNTTLFPSGMNVRTFRVVCDGDEKLSDSFTLAKLADGAQGAKGDKGDTGAMGTSGADAYTVLLTNESHAFAGSVSAALAGSTSCAVAAYKGAIQVAATIGSISGLPAGMTASIANNGTTKATITFTVTTSMTTASGTVNIPVTVDGKSFTRVFSYSIAFKGATGAQGAKGDKGDTGVAGKSIGAIINYYLATSSSSGVTTSTSGWTTTVQSVNATKKYLWNYEVIKYSDGTIASTSTPCIIGAYGDKGDTGATGNGISGITEYYQVSASNTTAPTSWATTIPAMTATNKYLWNYEKITYTNGNTEETNKRVIGVYGDKGATGARGAKGDKGDTGATGNGISGITEYYQVSASNTTAPTSWATTIPAMTATNKYLWNYEKITYTNGNTEETNKRVIGVYGDKGATGARGAKGDKGDTGATGNGISGITEYYQVSASNTTAPTSWATTIPAMTATNKYLWNYEKITYTNGNTEETNKRVIGVYGDKGATGARGAKGDKGDTGAQGIPGESINGKMLYKDPEFKLGQNGAKTYGAQNNGGSVTVSRIQKSSNANAAGSPYNDSDYCLYIKAYGGTSTNHLGGFCFINQSRANAVFIVKVSAKIPVGYTLKNAHNSYGTGSKQEQLTSMAGTGKYETYIFKVTCGSTGTFSTINHLMLSGPVKPSTAPLEWFVDYATVFDQTADGYSDIEITTKDSFAAQLGFTNFEELKLNAVDSGNGTLIQGGYINTNLIKADALIAVDGFIDKLKTNLFTANSIKANMLSVAGFNFADYKIYGGAAYGSGSGIQITSTTAERSFKAYKDTNNYIGMYYNSATDWGIKGVVGGATYLQLGNINKIGGFEIGSTYIQNNGLKLSSGSIEYKKDKLQSNFGALYTGITGIATGLYIKNTAISTTNRHELCAYFQGSIGDLKINSSKAMIETYNVSSMHYALYIPSGRVYMNANSGGIFFKNVQNVNGKSNYYLCIDRSTGQLYYR